MLEVAPTRGGQQARDILLGVLHSVIRNLVQRRVHPMLDWPCCMTEERCSSCTCLLL